MSKDDICPECGCDLEGLDREKHAIKHWGVTYKNLDRLANEEAKKRYKQVLGVIPGPKRKDPEEIERSEVGTMEVEE